jgi:hypothetical protein
MYCKVPSLNTIFVMSTSSKKDFKTQKTKHMLLLDNKLSTVLANRTKKVALMAALFMTVGIGSSFAAPIAPAAAAFAPAAFSGSSTDVLAVFHKDFRTADVMQVESKKDYTKVTFRMNGIVMFAYYSTDGDLLAVVRNILSTELPIHLLMELKQKHSDCWITDLFEMDHNGQTIYYASLENSDVKVTLRSTDNSSWETYQKENKETKSL